MRERGGESEDLGDVEKVRKDQPVIKISEVGEGVELCLAANVEQKEEPEFMSFANKRAMADHVYGGVTSINTRSDNFRFHDQNLAVNNEAMEKVSLLFGAVTETV